MKQGKCEKSLFCPGFKAAGLSSGIKGGGKLDLALIVSDPPATVAALYTKNKVKAAPVLLDMKRTRRKLSSGVIVNSGNANACTGPAGDEAALRMAEAAEAALGLGGNSMLVASTGVIGVPLPIEKIERGAKKLANALDPEGWRSAAEAIMTTDAFPKSSQASARIGGKKITITGIAKGAGMIRPDMATMLAFFATDAALGKRDLKRALRLAVDNSFNSISVDNDTSTNDMVMLFANGAAGGAMVAEGTPAYASFLKLLQGVALDLAKMIVRDGEGATKFVELHVKGAATEREARLAARAITESMLVKTALFGGDPNWGRILSALGISGIEFDPYKVNISIGNVVVARGGLDTGREKEAAKVMKARDLSVTVDLKRGKVSRKFYTTDLGHDYVELNSAYRT